jgi:hypothetical protein
MQSSNIDSNALDERRRYVMAFNRTMIKIWKEKITALGVVDTGALYRSVVAAETKADGKFIDIRLSQRFLMYGLYQNYGTGSNTWKGNPGDIGRNNLRRKRMWFSLKYFASVMNLKEFLADNIGKEFCGVVSNALSRR